MNCEKTDPVDGVDRRSVLAAGAAGLSLSLSGCIDSVRSVVNGDGDDQLSLSIVTVPADGDREALRIANHLESNLQAVGVNANVKVRSRTEFLEMILIDNDFDLYVGRHPADYDPDFLYEALHSTYAYESGWQNPFGFGSTTYDILLEEQRRATGDERIDRIEPVLKGLAEEKPFDPICRPDEVRVANTEQYEGWGDSYLATRHGYLGLEPDSGRLNALVTDARPSKNVNPLSATVRDRGTIVDLLYDSLGTLRENEDGAFEVQPWLAESWEPVADTDTDDPATDSTDETTTSTDSTGETTTSTDSTGETTTSTDSTGETTTFAVRLREDCTFHGEDEVPVTAGDVAFTYRFLKDTTLGQADTASPAPRYRGQVSLINSIATGEDSFDIEDEYELRITVNAGEEVAKRAFTVPILPRHIWREELRDRIDNGNFTAPQGRWGLVTTDSVPPIGSGPYQFVDSSERSYLDLERFDDHFTRRDDDLPDAVEELRFNIDPGSQSSIARVRSGAADVTASMLNAYSLADIPDESGIERLEDTSWTFYHLGFNTRIPPCSNPHFRRAVAQLIDKEWVAEEVFYGNAEPLATPVADEWIAPSEDDNFNLEWNGEDPVTPFVGTEGTLNVEAARAAFETAGYSYDNDGRLLGKY